MREGEETVEIGMIEIEEKGRQNYTHEIIFLPLNEKKNVLQIFIAFELKNKADENIFKAHGKSYKVKLLGNSSHERKVQGPSVCHQCPLKALGGAGERWHPEIVYFKVSLKMSERGPWGPHFITQPSGALRSAGCWPPGGERSVNNCDCSVPCPVFWGITVPLFLETAPEVEEALPVGPSFPP